MTQKTPPLTVIPGGRDQLERQLIELMFRPHSRFKARTWTWNA